MAISKFGIQSGKVFSLAVLVNGGICGTQMAVESLHNLAIESSSGEIASVLESLTFESQALGLTYDKCHVKEHVKGEASGGAGVARGGGGFSKSHSKEANCH